MAHILYLDEVGQNILKLLARSFQSGHVNFLIGSGASLPAIPSAGAIEQEIAHLFATRKDDIASSTMHEFLAGIQGPMNKLIKDEDDGSNAETLNHYKDYLGIIETILSERQTNLLPKKATIFTTNYDFLSRKHPAATPP